MCQHNQDLKTLHRAYKVDEMQVNISGQVKMEEFDHADIKHEKMEEEMMEEGAHKLSARDENLLHEKFVQRLYKYGANDTFVRCYLEHTKTERIEATHEELNNRVLHKKQKRRSWYARYMPFQASDDED